MARGRTAPAGPASSPACSATATPWTCPPTRWEAWPPTPRTSPRTSRRSPGPSCWSATPTAASSSPNAATGNPNIKALVYVDAYIPAQGDTLNALTSKFPGSEVSPDVLDFAPEPGGVLDAYIKQADFRGVLANDLPAGQAAEIAATQRPIAASALDEPSAAPAWATIPSWDVIGTADHALPAAAQEFMAQRAGSTVTKIHASHLSMISHPRDVRDVIEQAARRTS